MQADNNAAINAVEVVDVFTSKDGGGNPAPIIIDADGIDEAAMQAIAKAYGHESGFVFHANVQSGHDYQFRFFVPRHEMSMCGHVTIGTVWLLHRHGRLSADTVSIQTLSGSVTAHIRADASGEHFVEISQPAGTVTEISKPHLRAEIIEAIGLKPEDIADMPFLNACTSRVKTLIPVINPQRLDAARPDSERIDALCGQIDSTGLYLFCHAAQGGREFDARQFPKSSGYPEDAATGIAATALAFGLVHYGLIDVSNVPVAVHQGRAMGRPSDITVRFDLAQDAALPPVGCFVSGNVAYSQVKPLSATENQHG